MKPSFVIDASVAIEFASRKLLKEVCALPFTFIISRQQFESELIDLEPYTKHDLLDYGVRVEDLNDAGVTAIQKYKLLCRALSTMDTFALALASTKGCVLLTGDKRMRKTAENDGIKVNGALWVIDSMIEHQVVSIPKMMEALKNMMNDDKCWIPQTELDIRLKRLFNDQQPVDARSTST